MRSVRRVVGQSALALTTVGMLAIAGCSSTSKSSTSNSSSSSSAGGATKKGVVKIGVDESLTGSFAAIGIPPADAVKTAAKQINDAGGFTVGDTTYTLEVTTLDDRSTGATAVANVTQLVQDDGIKFVFGPTTSALASQAAVVTVANNAIQFTAAGSLYTAGALKDPAKPLLFGTQNPLEVLAKEQAAGIEKLGGNVIGILSQDDDTSKGNVPPVVTALRADGKTVIDERYPTNTTDFTSILTKMKSEGMETLFYFYPQARAAQVIALALQLNAAPKGFATRNVDPAVALSQAIGRPLPVPFFSLQGTPSFQYPPNDKVKAAAAAILATDPAMPLNSANFAFFTYDFVPILTKAMQAAGTVTDTAKIATEISKVTYDGAGGKICFQPDQRNAIYDTGSVFVRDGKVESTSNPSSCK